MSFIEGIVTVVVEDVAGSELAVSASVSDTELEVVDGLDYDDEGGELTVGDSDPMTYTVADPDVPETLTVPALADAYDAETPVLIYPRAIERFAYVMAPESDEEMVCRVPHALYDRLAVGTREAGGENVIAALEDDEWVVADVLDRTPSVDASYLNSGSNEAPVVTAQTPTGGYVATDAVLTVTPEADGKLLVFWGADAQFSRTGGDRVTGLVTLSLLVDGVQVGQERTAAVDARSVSGDTDFTIPIQGATIVEVEAGVEVELAIGVTGSEVNGAVAVVGSKTGGLSYVAFGA